MTQGQEWKQSIDAQDDPIVELMNKTFKAAIISVFNDLKEK